jgi:hypothetical protein
MARLSATVTSSTNAPARAPWCTVGAVMIGAFPLSSLPVSTANVMTRTTVITASTRWISS